MRFMILVKSSPDTERGAMPTVEELDAMGKFNAEMVKAGILLAGEGLHPSSTGARVIKDGKSTTVVDGPFAETKELLAGFWLVDVSSYEEALEWATRAPQPSPSGDAFVMEVRKVFEAEDFTTATPEQIAAENELRAQIEGQQRG